MLLDLGRDDVGQHPPLFGNGGGGLVAGRFDG